LKRQEDAGAGAVLRVQGQEVGALVEDWRERERERERERCGE
jgi:hypothetical protein